jgi:hypothetical protein
VHNEYRKDLCSSTGDRDSRMRQVRRYGRLEKSQSWGLGTMSGIIEQGRLVEEALERQEANQCFLLGCEGCPQCSCRKRKHCRHLSCLLPDPTLSGSSEVRFWQIQTGRALVINAGVRLQPLIYVGNLQNNICPQVPGKIVIGETVFRRQEQQALHRSVRWRMNCFPLLWAV